MLETVDFTMSAAYERTLRAFRDHRDISALFAVADSMAIAAMKAIHTVGLRVPAACSIVAIDGIEVSQYTIPTLTTLVQPQAAMGEKAVDILLDVLSGAAPHRHVRLETTLREGETLGAVCLA